MIDKIELTEEQAREIWKAIDCYEQYDWDLWTLLIKQAGYIKQNPVEKAEEILNSFENINRDEDYTVDGNDIEDIIIGFNCLKKQLKEKNNS